MLTNDEILDMVYCRSDLSGDYISWKDMKLPDIASHTMPLIQLCQIHSDPIYFIFLFVVYSMAQYLCNALNSSMPQPTSWEDLNATVAAIDSQGLNLLKYVKVWLPYNDIENEGVWRSDADENVAPILLWRDGEPNGFTYENCAGLTREGVHDYSCNELHVSAACKAKDKPVFILHSSGKKQTYFLADQDEVGVLVFQGYEGSAILKVDGYWKWKGFDNNILATLNNDKVAFPMGRHSWMVEGEQRMMLLTHCPQDHFTCNDATCVPMEQLCDYKFDCKDLSDEATCENLMIPNGYQKSLPPLPSDGQLLITINFHVMTVAVITEDMRLELSFQLTTIWTDSQLKFYNLKESRFNWLTYKDLEHMWTPFILFPNAEGNEYTVVDHNTIARINRNCTPVDKSTRLAREGI